MYGYKKDLVIFAIFIFSALSVFLATPDIFASASSDSLAGKILLQVQERGEAWYVNPGDEKRYFLGKPNDAFALMRNLGVGITNANLNRIQVADNRLAGEIDNDGDGLSDALEDSLGTDKNKADTDGDGHDDRIEILTGYNPLGAGKLPIDNTFASAQKGKILLQVQKNGEAWYVNPDNNKRYFLGRPVDAFNLMRKIGLGITNRDLNKIPLSKASSTPAISAPASSAQPPFEPVPSTPPSAAQASSTEPYFIQPSAPATSSIQELPIQDNPSELELIHCDSLNCLIGTASACRISEATYNLTIPFPLVPGEKMETVIHAIVMGRNPDGSCTITQQMEGSVISITEQNKKIMLGFGLTSDQIDAQIKSANESLNSYAVLKAILACQGTGENIAAYLVSSQTGIKSLGCLLQGGEKERSCTIEPGLSCVMKMP